MSLRHGGEAASVVPDLKPDRLAAVVQVYAPVGGDGIDQQQLAPALVVGMDGELRPGAEGARIGVEVAVGAMFVSPPPVRKREGRLLMS
jgi:hypothetical protein